MSPPSARCAPRRSTLASAIAARTKRMKIGTGVQVLPLCHPLRLAEEAATVDQISHGRLIFGVGRSGFPRTYEAYGVPYGESRERFAETLEILKRAWTEPSFSYHGKYYSFDNVKLIAEALPEALAGDPHRRQQRRHLPGDRQARPRRVRRGAARHARGARTEHHAPTARPGRRRAIPARARCSCALRSMSPTPTGRRARSRKKASCISTAISASGSRIRRPAPGCARSRTRAARGRRLQTITYDEALRDKIIVGTPERVADRLMGLQEDLGLDGILAEMNCGTKIPHPGDEIAAAAVRKGQASVPLK